MRFKELFQRVYDKQNLQLEESRQAVLSMMSGEWEPAQTGAFLTTLHMKGETAEELAGFAMAMLERAVSVPLNGIRTIDTCGTGGDRKGSFNISTLAAFVLAGCGIPVVKHGNRASSSSCGSADLLEALGMRYRLSPEEAAEAAKEIGFSFLFAPDYHPATKLVAALRKQLGVPTIFNLLGPLTNPAHPSAQLIGVYDQDALPRMVQAIHLMDPHRRVILLHSKEGFDEATPCSSFVLQIGICNHLVTHSQNFGLSSCTAEELRGGSPQENAAIAWTVLRGERGARRDTVLLNALLGYMAYYPDCSSEQALAAATESLDSGAALRVVERYKQRFGPQL